MSDEKRILIPSYLIEKEGYVNESQDKEKVLYFEHSDNGSMVKDTSRSPDAEQVFVSRNMSLRVEENFNRDFTLDVKYKASQSVTLMRFNGDNATTSLTQITASAGGLYFNRWRSTYRKTIRFPEGEPDADGFINVTLVRSGSQLLIYQYNVLQVIWTIGNTFDNKDVEILPGSSTIKRLSLSMGVALPREMHYEAFKSKREVREDNLKLVNLRTDVYDTTSFTNRMVKDIASHGQWIIALYDDNFMEAFSRPRGIDKGTSIESIAYDQITGKTTIILEDEQEFEFEQILNPANITPIPEGTGILSVDDVHKPLEIGDGIIKRTVPRGANKIIIWSAGELPQSTVSYLTDSNKPMGPLDYSKRLTLKQIVRPGKLRYPSLYVNATGGDESWLPLEHEASTSNLDIFEIDNKGEVTLPKGEIFIRGAFSRYLLQSKRYSFRITDGIEDIISKSWVTQKDEEVSERTVFEFEERVFLFEEKKIRVEEIIYYQRNSASDSNISGTMLSKIEFFKL